MTGLPLSQCRTQLSVISRASRLPGVTMHAPDSSKGKKSGNSTVARMVWSIPWASEGREPADGWMCRFMRQVVAPQCRSCISLTESVHSRPPTTRDVSYDLIKPVAS